jgi:signal transduction histidine kinase
MRNDLAILRTILRTVGQDSRTDVTLARTVEKIADLTGWHGVSLLNPTGTLGERVVIASAGSQALPIGATISDTALTPARDGASGTIHYISNAARLRSVFSGLQAVESMIVVPLTSYGPTCATLLFTSDHADGFDDQDLTLAEALRDAFVLAYQNAYTYIGNTGYLHTWMASSNDGVILLDNELQVTMLNRPALNYLNLPGSVEAWQQRPIWDLVKQMRTDAPDIVDQIVADIQHTQAGRDEPSEGEYKLDLQIIHWYSLPVRNQQHQLGRTLILRNMTKDQLLRGLRRDLTETMVSDIQAPLGHLTSILASITPENDNQRSRGDRHHAVENALSTAQTMLTTINEFIDVSRLESGQMPLSPSAFSFPDLVENVVRMEQPLAQERHLNLEKHVDESLPLMWGDRHLIQRLLRHVITNALKTTPPGRNVRVEADVTPRSADKIRVSIGDTDKGSSRPPRNRVTLQTSRDSQDHGGYEPWLAFCRIVLEAHGERMWISRSDDAGITVTFNLPQVSESLAQLEAYS